MVNFSIIEEAAHVSRALACTDASHRRRKTSPGKPAYDGTAGGTIPELNRASDSASSSLYLTILRIFLLNEQDCPATSRWLESTKSLGATSLQTCEQCRDIVYFEVQVGRDTPRSIWETRARSHIGGKSSAAAAGVDSPTTSDAKAVNRAGSFAVPLRACSTRVPPMKIAKLTWNISNSANAIFFPADAGGFRWLKEVRFGEDFGHSVSDISWPNRLRVLGFRSSFSHPISTIQWPSCLEQLELEGGFDQTLVGSAWPAGLKALTLGNSFNQPIDAVVWPAELRELKFGREFNQRLTKIGEGAAGLRALTLGWQFDQSLDGIILPDNLEVLTIVGVYNRPLDRVKLPPGLKKLTLGGHFDRPLTAVRLPRRLEVLSLGWAFNRPLLDVDWPPRLKTLSLGYRFNQPAECVIFPSRMEFLELGVFSRQSLRGIVWPSTLITLTVGRAFDLAGMRLPEGAFVSRRGRQLTNVQHDDKL